MQREALTAIYREDLEQSCEQLSNRKALVVIFLSLTLLIQGKLT